MASRSLTKKNTNKGEPTATPTVRTTSTTGHRPKSKRHQRQVELASLSELLHANVEIKDRKWRTKTYRQCFLHSEAIQWMMQYQAQQKEEEEEQQQQQQTNPTEPTKATKKTLSSSLSKSAETSAVLSLNALRQAGFIQHVVDPHKPFRVGQGMKKLYFCFVVQPHAQFTTNRALVSAGDSRDCEDDEPAPTLDKKDDAETTTTAALMWDEDASSSSSSSLSLSHADHELVQHLQTQLHRLQSTVSQLSESHVATQTQLDIFSQALGSLWQALAWMAVLLTLLWVYTAAVLSSSVGSWKTVTAMVGGGTVLVSAVALQASWLVRIWSSLQNSVLQVAQEEDEDDDDEFFEPQVFVQGDSSTTNNNELVPDKDAGSTTTMATTTTTSSSGTSARPRLSRHSPFLSLLPQTNNGTTTTTDNSMEEKSSMTHMYLSSRNLLLSSSSNSTTEEKPRDNPEGSQPVSAQPTKSQPPTVKTTTAQSSEIQQRQADDLPPPSTWPNRPLLLCVNTPVSSQLKVPNHGTGPCPIGQPFSFESEVFHGTCLVRIRDLPTSDSVAGDEAYFAGRRRLFQMIVQGRFKQALTADNVLTGHEFVKPLQHLPHPWILKAATNLIGKLAPGCEISMAGPNPTMLAPLAATSQIVRGDEPGNEPDIWQAGQHDTDEVQEDCSLLVVNPHSKNSSSSKKAATPLSNNAAKRKVHLSHPQRAAHYTFDTETVYTFDFYQSLLNCTTYSLDLGFANIGMTRILNGQPIQCLAKTKSDGRYLWSFQIWHENLLPKNSMLQTPPSATTDDDTKKKQ